MSRHVTLDVRGAKCSDSTADVIDLAIKLRSAQEADDSDDCVWALLDTEHLRHNRAKAVAEKRRGEANHIRVALSDPCYEVWTLSHVEDTGKQFLNCRKVIERIKQQWRSVSNAPFEKKSQADYVKLMQFRETAAERAKRHWENRDKSRTEVYRIIEQIETIRQPETDK